MRNFLKKQKRLSALVTAVITATVLTIQSHANVFDDLLSGLGNKLVEVLANWNSKLYGAVGTMFTFAMDTAGTSTSFEQYLPGKLIKQHPAEFGGGSIWTMVERICNNVIVPIAAFMLMIVLVTDLVQILTSGNQFQEANLATIMKWFIKAVVGLVIVSNVYYIASGIFSIGVSAGSGGLGELHDVMSDTITIKADVLSFGDVGFLLLMLLFGLITILLVFVLFLVISAVLAGRIIEIFMYMSVAPLTAATFMNNEWKSVGYGWVKGVIALAFQGFFVVIALAVFTGIFGELFKSLNVYGTTSDFLLGIGILDAYLVALMFTVMRSGSISKSIFNAH